jgi:GTP-binding protein
MARKLEAQFLMSAAKPEQFPPAAKTGGGPEVAFLGRSNVGKSTLLNALVGHKNLAFVSARPGCTQLINFYRVDGGLVLVDLPGYGYAKVPGEITADWQQLIERYLLEREALQLCVVLLDARRGWMDKDRLLKEWLEHHRRPYVVAATKVDKLTARERTENLAAIQREMNGGEILPVSAPTGRGVRELWQTIWKINNPNKK